MTRSSLQSEDDGALVVGDSVAGQQIGLWIVDDKNLFVEFVCGVCGV